jgi:hypothetical protein
MAVITVALFVYIGKEGVVGSPMHFIHVPWERLWVTAGAIVPVPVPVPVPAGSGPFHWPVASSVVIAYFCAFFCVYSVVQWKRERFRVGW